MMTTKRDELIDAVLRGKMPPGQAEKEAARLGLGPLATTPDPAGFGPRSKTRWTLLMTLAWIMRRDGDQSILTLENAKKELWSNLAAEWLSAFGIQESADEKVTIPAQEWCNMEMHHRDGSVKLSFGGKSYSDITLISGDVRTLWKSDADEQSDAAERRKASDRILSDVTSPYDDPKDGWMYLRDIIYWVMFVRQSSHQDAYYLAGDEVFEAVFCKRLKVWGVVVSDDLKRKGNAEEIEHDYFETVSLTGENRKKAFFSAYDDEEYAIYEDDGETQVGGSLTLAEKNKPEWARLRCRKDKVRELWPDRTASAEDSAVAISSAGRKPRKRNEVNDALNKARYERVKTRMDRLSRKHPGHSKSSIRRSLVDQNKNEGFADSTLKHIQSGNYPAMNRR